MTNALVYIVKSGVAFKKGHFYRPIMRVPMKSWL